MTPQTTARRWDADLDGCPHCGAHRWRLLVEVPASNRVTCDECNHAYERHELVSNAGEPYLKPFIDGITAADLRRARALLEEAEHGIAYVLAPEVCPHCGEQACKRAKALEGAG